MVSACLHFTVFMPLRTKRAYFCCSKIGMGREVVSIGAQAETECYAKWIRPSWVNAESGHGMFCWSLLAICKGRCAKGIYGGVLAASYASSGVSAGTESRDCDRTFSRAMAALPCMSGITWLYVSIV